MIESKDDSHTFCELYAHRNELFIALCRTLYVAGMLKKVWKSTKHSDGKQLTDYFVLGVDTKENKQISYHIPIDRWDDCWFAEAFDTALWDGHTSEDVLIRLKTIDAAW